MTKNLRGLVCKFVSLLLLSSALLPPLAHGARADDFYLSLSLTRGEHSRDSNSSTTLITVAGEKVTYEKTFRGRQPRGRQPIHKEFKFAPQDVERLKEIIKTHDLLKSDSIAAATKAAGFTYFEIAIKLRLDGRESAINLSGPARDSKIKDEQLYKSSDALIQEVFRLIHAQDEAIDYEELVN